MSIKRFFKSLFTPKPSVQQLKQLPSLYPSEIRAIFNPPHEPWMVEVKHPRVNENNIFIFCDINIHHVYLVWHCINNPGHWRVISNKGINTTIPDHWQEIF